MTKRANIPEPFLHPPFYDEKDVIVLGDRTRYFYFDIAHALSWEEEKPWLEKKKTIRAYFAQWQSLKERLAKCYENRDRKCARPFMLKGIAYFIDILFWMNDRPVRGLNQLKDELRRLTYKPMNIEERLTYILCEVDHFHAYNQLKALFEELEKIYYKSMIGND